MQNLPEGENTSFSLIHCLLYWLHLHLHQVVDYHHSTLHCPELQMIHHHHLQGLSSHRSVHLHPRIFGQGSGGHGVHDHWLDQRQLHSLALRPRCCKEFLHLQNVAHLGPPPPLPNHWVLHPQNVAHRTATGTSSCLEERDSWQIMQAPIAWWLRALVLQWTPVMKKYIPNTEWPADQQKVSIHFSYMNC